MKLTLIPDWKKAWKFSSVLYAVLGLLISCADLILQFVPFSSFTDIPHRESILLVLFGLVILGRYTQFKGKCDDEPEDEQPKESRCSGDCGCDYCSRIRS